MKNNWLPWLYAFMLVAVAHEHLARVADGTFHRVALQGTVIPFFSLIAGYLWGTVLRKTKGRGVLSGMQLFVLPYLFWATFYLVFSHVFLHSFARHESFGLSWYDIVLWYVTGSRTFHLWFMPPLIYSMLILILLFRVVQNKNVRLSFLIGLTAFSFAVYFHVWPLSYISNVHFLGWPFSYVFSFVCLGSLLAQAKSAFYQNIRFKKLALPVVWAVGAFNICMWENSFVLVLAIWLTTLSFPNIYVPKWLTGLLPYTMGIYVVHLIFTWIGNFALHALGYERFAVWPGWAVGLACFVCSWILVRWVRKIPYCSYVV